MIRLMAPHFPNVAAHAETNTMKSQQQITIKTGVVKQPEAVVKMANKSCAVSNLLLWD